MDTSLPEVVPAAALVRELLLDTNVLSELTRPTPRPRVVANVAAPEHRSAIAGIT